MVKWTSLILCLFPWLVQAQELTFEEVKKLPSSINSDAEEIFPLLSPDGKTLFFVRSRSAENIGGKFSGTDIWKSDFDVTTREWGKPSNSRDLFNDKGNDAVVGISNKGDVLYMLNTVGNKNTKGIYFSKKIGSQWTKPELIPIPGIKSDGFLGAYVSPDFDVIILSMNLPGGSGEEDLYVSLKNPQGEWSAPKNMGPSVNTSGFEISPFLSADKKRLYFSSSGHTGFGDADIFYSDRLYDDSWETWTSAQNLGAKINSEKFDGYLSMPNDSLVFFSSTREESSVNLFSCKITKKPTEAVDLDIRFLTENETIGLLGGDLDVSIVFEVNSAVLSIPSRNQLSRISRALYNKQNVKIHLVAKRLTDTVDLETNKQRLFNILDYLKEQGIEGGRITFGSEVLPVGSSSSAEVVLLKFYY